MIVVCSPAGRQSDFVSDEISAFAAIHGADRVFPVLRSGLADNEADDQKAFPPGLLKAVHGMPLAADSRDFDVRQGRKAGSMAEAEWYKLIANIEQTTPDKVREVDKERQVRSLRTRLKRAAVVVASLVAGAALLGYLWWRAWTAERRNEEMSVEGQTFAADLNRQLDAKNQEISELRAQIETRRAAKPQPGAVAGAATPLRALAGTGSRQLD